MRIGMILDSSFPPDPRVENEAISLIQDHQEVHLFCLDYTQKKQKRESINGINVHRVHLPKILYSFSALAYTIPIYHFFLSISIYRFVREHQIEIFHIHDIQIARSVFWINNILKLPIVLDLHENRPEIMKFYYHVKTRLGKLLISPSRWREFEFEYIKKADHVITVTQEAADYYQKEIPVQPSKFCVVPNTVRRSFYSEYERDEAISPKDSQDSFSLLYLGDTGLRRGLMTILESLKFLIPAISNLKIIIVGKSKEDVVLKNFVKENNYEKYVKFMGWQDFSLFQSYIAASDIGVCPIHKNLHHDTTYANKIFQYMALGLPIIVSNCTSQQVLVEKYKCGLVFEDRDSKDFSEKVISIAKDKEYYQKLSKNAFQAIDEHLNWETTSKNLLSLYKK